MQVFDLDGIATRTFPGRAEGAPAVLCRPHGLARGPNGLVYVADTGHHRVAAFSPDGALRFAFGRSGAEPGAFDEPRGLAVAGDWPSLNLTINLTLTLTLNPNPKP